MIVKRPDGTEFTRYTLALGGAGALYQQIALPKSSRRGRWSAATYIDPKGAPVGRVEFSVEDFVPEKLKVELTAEQSLLRPGKPNRFTVQADFLYGAPAAGLSAEADMRVTVDAQPFPAFAAYTFGLERERSKYEPPLITLSLGVILHAFNGFLVATALPTAVLEIGGIQFMSWSFTVYLVLSIVGGAGAAGALSPGAAGVGRFNEGCHPVRAAACNAAAQIRGPGFPPAALR